MMLIFRGLLIACTLLIPGVLRGQSPHLAGHIEIGLPQGLLSGDVCLSNLPEQDTLTFLLHRGLNIRSIRAPSGNRLPYQSGDRLVGAGLPYTVAGTVRSGGLCVSYTGAFPVYADTSAAFDYKSVIAFGSETLRAAEEAKWYPVLYDPGAERDYAAVAYDLRVNCPACTAMYVNGERPKRGTDLEFASREPVAPLLFVGKFDFQELDGTVYLNSDLSDSAARGLSQTVGAIKDFYAEFLGVPYGQGIVFLEFQPVTYFRPGRSWAFVTWPTIAFAGIPLEALATILADTTAANPAVLGFVAHEMGHYYFSPVPGAYAQFYSESMAEYVSLKAIERFVGEEAYQGALLERYRAVLEGPPLTPLDRASKEEISTDRYRYRYGPLLLAALEREVGLEAMRGILHRLLTAPADRVRDYAALRRAALDAGVSEEAWEHFERTCVHAPLLSGCWTDLTG